MTTVLKLFEASLDQSYRKDGPIITAAIAQLHMRVFGVSLPSIVMPEIFISLRVLILGSQWCAFAVRFLIIEERKTIPISTTMREITFSLFLLCFSAGAASAFVQPLPTTTRRLIPPSLTVARATLEHTTNAQKGHEIPRNKDAKEFTIPLDEVCLDDLPKVGGKTASLGEMIQQLAPLGVAVPGGFAVSSTAYDAVLDRVQLRERLTLLLKDIDGKQELNIYPIAWSEM